MHICFLGEIATKHVSIGGIGSFAANLIPELIRQGCQISAIGFRKQDSALIIEKAEGFNIYWINTYQWGVFRSIKKLIDTNKIIKQLHAAHRIDIIDSAEGGFFMVKKIRGIQFIVRLHGGHLFFANSTSDTPISYKSAFIEKNSLKKADAVIGVSQYVWKRTVKYYPWLEKLPQQIIANPIIVEKFYASDAQKVMPGTILFIGSLNEKKGIRQLIHAMPHVNEKIHGAWLHIYGRDIPVKDTGESYKAVLDKTISSLCLENVTIHQHVPNHEIPAIIEKASLVVLPSHMEAMPLAWLEALAMEKAFIGSKLGPGPEIIQHGFNGLLCDPFDPADIAEKIVYLLNHQNEAAKMGKEARKSILADFNVNILAQKNIRFFNDLCSIYRE